MPLSTLPQVLQPYAMLALLPSGFLTLPEHFFCADQHDKSVRNFVPSMSFLIRHPGTNRTILFDLGIRKRLEDYPDDIQPHLQSRLPIQTTPDVCESLLKGGLEPDDIDAVILSHVHYDHVGDPRQFSRAKFIVGSGTKHLLQHGMNYHSAAKFEKDLLPEDRTIELPATGNHYHRNGEHSKSICQETAGLETFIPNIDHSWKPLGPFDNAIDLFGDGLVYIIDSPGHLVGHINVIARIASDHWVYLAGDACHHHRILDGDTEMASWIENGQSVCIHANRDVASDTIRRIRELRDKGFGKSSKVEVALAHDIAFFNSHEYCIWPGQFGPLHSVP